jgi:glucosamine-6-phosphate deaminase
MDIRIVEPAAFAATALSVWRDCLRGFDAPRLGLPTGRTVVPVYAELAASGTPLPSGATAFAIDEYCWPERLYSGTNAAFFAAHWPFAATVPVLTPDAAAADPVAEIARHCAAIAAAGGLDLVLLGIGRNGHVAFNEPGSTDASDCRVVALTEATRAQVAADWPDPPTRGMTVGVRQLLAAKRLIVLASGAEKQAAVAAAFGADPQPATTPAALLRDHPRLTVICDAAAALLLR